MKRHEALTLKEGDRVTRLQSKFLYSTNQWVGMAVYRPAPGKEYYPGSLIYQQKSVSPTAWHLDVQMIVNGRIRERAERINTQSVAIVPQAQEQSAA